MTNVLVDSIVGKGRRPEDERAFIYDDSLPREAVHYRKPIVWLPMSSNAKSHGLYRSFEQFISQQILKCDP
jgi:hypothetical protein